MDVLDFNPNAENMARWISDQIPRVPGGRAGVRRDYSYYERINEIFLLHPGGRLFCGTLRFCAFYGVICSAHIVTPIMRLCAGKCSVFASSRAVPCQNRVLTGESSLQQGYIFVE
jgi:hypothetical protein